MAIFPNLRESKGESGGHGSDPDTPPKPTLAVPVLPAGVEYTHTRILDISPEELRERRVVAAIRADPLTDCYRVLRTQVLLKMHQEGWTTLGVTSPARGVGSTLTAVNLAVSLSQDINHTVLLVDLDLRQPSVHRYFVNGNVPGLSDYLLNNDLPELLFNPGIERLVVLPGNQPISNSSEFLVSPRICGLIDELKGRYESRIVIFDLPPVLTSDDVLVVGRRLDALLLVVGDGITRQDELKRSQQLLSGMNLIGTVLNKAHRGTRP
jgi:capsular exopolysaccharide synthesis family protein